MTRFLPLHRLLPLFFLGWLLVWQNVIQSKSEATQQWVSTLVGGVASGGMTGASTALDGEKYNRQLHQREIAWIKKNAAAFAKKLYGDNPTPEQIADATARLTQQALRGVDKGWSLKLGSKTDESAKEFLDQNDADMFTVKSDSEFYDPTITRYGDKTTKIKDLSDQQKADLKRFYADNTQNASKTPLKDLYIADLKKRGIQKADEIIESLKNTPGGIKAAYDYLKNTPAEQIATDTAQGVTNTVNAIKDTISEGVDAATSSGEIARNTDGTADLLNDLYNDKTAADAGRMMVDEDLLEAATLVGGAAKGAIKGITKIGGGKVRVTLENGKSVEVPQSSIVTGPNGGRGVKTGHKTSDGHDIIQRESGGYYYVDSATGKQVRVNSPSTHGNTLNDTPAECYGLYCRETGDLVKIGETTHGEVRYGAGGQKRYSPKELREMNAKYEKMTEGTKKEMYRKQIEDLEAYKKEHGEYPKYNINGR